MTPFHFFIGTLDYQWYIGFSFFAGSDTKKAEPFKLWLTQVGRERIEETLDPELNVGRLVYTYERAGYTQEWINQRLQTISARKELTDEWKSGGIQQSKEYAILTDELTRV